MSRNGATTIRSRRRILANCLGCTLALTALGLPGRAAELAGICLPDTVQEDGTTLYLNGIGLRTYSFLHIPRPPAPAAAFRGSCAVPPSEKRSSLSCYHAIMRCRWPKDLQSSH